MIIPVFRWLKPHFMGDSCTQKQLNMIGPHLSKTSLYNGPHSADTDQRRPYSLKPYLSIYSGQVRITEQKCGRFSRCFLLGDHHRQAAGVLAWQKILTMWRPKHVTGRAVFFLNYLIFNLGSILTSFLVFLVLVWYIYIYSRKKSLALEYNEKNSTHAMFFIVFVMKPTGIFCCESRSWLFFNHWIDPWDRRFYERITGSLFSPTAGPQPPASTSLTCASCVTTHQRFTRSPRFFAIVQLMSSIRWHGCLWMTRYCSMKYLEVSWSFAPVRKGLSLSLGP